MKFREQGSQAAVYSFIVILVVLTILALGLLASCSSPTPHAVNPDAFYKYDLELEVNDRELRGVAVVPFASEYKIKIDPPGKIDRIMWRTCHREEVVDAPSTGFSGKYSFKLTPTKIELSSACGLHITVLEEKKRRNAFARIEFEDSRPEFSLDSQLTCNGSLIKTKGVSICQSSKGLRQEIEFSSPVVVVQKESRCDIMGEVAEKKKFSFFMPEGECVFVFTAQEKATNGQRKKHRLTLIGYTDVPPIKQ